jgi:hypothetical protein
MWRDKQHEIERRFDLHYDFCSPSKLIYDLLDKNMQHFASK